MFSPVLPTFEYARTLYPASNTPVSVVQPKIDGDLGIERRHQLLPVRWVGNVAYHCRVQITVRSSADVHSHNRQICNDGTMEK